MRAFLFALEIEPLRIGAQYHHLELHCTILHWFRTHASLEAVLTRTRPIFHNTPTIELIAGEKALFGPSRGLRNIPVNLVKKTPPFAALHAKLKDTVERLGVEHTEPYIGDAFRAHVTKQGSSRFYQGSRHLSKATYLIEALDSKNLTKKHVHARLLHRA